MSHQPVVARGERHVFEVDSMSVDGLVTELGDGQCAVDVIFTNRPTPKLHRLRLSPVDRHGLATLFRSFADSLAPPVVLAFHAWCELHVSGLEGKPQWLYDPITQTWNTDLIDMECPHDAGSDSRTACRPEWRLGAVPLQRKERRP
jgi:hypothetical protein